MPDKKTNPVHDAAAMFIFMSISVLASTSLLSAVFSAMFTSYAYQTCVILSIVTGTLALGISFSLVIMSMIAPKEKAVR
jgi:hypothetical protein